MSPDGRRLLRDLALLIGIPLALAIGVAVWVMPWSAMAELMVVPYAAADGDAYAVAEGRWDWTGKSTHCEEDWHDIRFSPDRSTMTIRHARPAGDSAGAMKQEWVYDILRSDSTSIRGRIRGEKRLNMHGQPVIWDLVLTGKDAYRWHETTWAAGNYTAEVRRCPAPPGDPNPIRDPA